MIPQVALLKPWGSTMVIWITENGTKEQQIARLISNRLVDAGLSVFIFHNQSIDDYATTIQNVKSILARNLYAVVSSKLPLNKKDLVIPKNLLLLVHCQQNGDGPRPDVDLNLTVTHETALKCAAQVIIRIQKLIGCFTCNKEG
jgi:hypothetical protein